MWQTHFFDDLEHVRLQLLGPVCAHSQIQLCAAAVGLEILGHSEDGIRGRHTDALEHGRGGGHRGGCVVWRVRGGEVVGRQVCEER